VRRRWQRLQSRDAQSVDVTPFLSLMVILVPFLLVTAVFSRTTLLEVQAAGKTDGGAAGDGLALQVMVREESFEVNYVGQQQLEVIARSSGELALAALADLVADLKSRHPENEDATVLVEPQVPYETVVQVLDILRMRDSRIGSATVSEALFPRIALGPAPASTGGLPQ